MLVLFPNIKEQLISEAIPNNVSDFFEIGDLNTISVIARKILTMVALAYLLVELNKLDILKKTHSRYNFGIGVQCS